MPIPKWYFGGKITILVKLGVEYLQYEVVQLDDRAGWALAIAGV